MERSAAGFVFFLFFFFFARQCTWSDWIISGAHHELLDTVPLPLASVKGIASLEFVTADSLSYNQALC